MKENILKGITIFFLLGISILATGCSVQDKEIIPCGNPLGIDCSANDCSNQCADYASNNGKALRSSNPVNNGEGCECYMDVIN